MKLAAVAGLIAVCVWAGMTYPLIALTGLLVFATIGATYEAIRTQK